MITNMIVNADKGYRIFYSTGLGKYIMGCTITEETVIEEFFEITSVEYSDSEYNPVHLNCFADMFSSYRNFSPRFCSPDKVKILKKELKEYAKENKSGSVRRNIRIMGEVRIINKADQLIRNDFRTLCLIAKINSLALKFKSGVIPFSEMKSLNEPRLIYDDKDIMFNNGNIIFCRIVNEVSEDASGTFWIESFYDDSDFNGMECFLMIGKDGSKRIWISMNHEDDTIEIYESGEWGIVR